MRQRQPAGVLCPGPAPLPVSVGAGGAGAAPTASCLQEGGAGGGKGGGEPTNSRSQRASDTESERRRRQSVGGWARRPAGELCPGPVAVPVSVGDGGAGVAPTASSLQEGEAGAS
jgi:hypothetical protein